MAQYNVAIRAQVEWTTDIEADSPEDAKEFAKDDFELSIETGGVDILLINSVHAELAKGDNETVGV